MFTHLFTLSGEIVLVIASIAGVENSLEDMPYWTCSIPSICAIVHDLLFLSLSLALEYCLKVRQAAE